MIEILPQTTNYKHSSISLFQNQIQLDESAFEKEMNYLKSVQISPSNNIINSILAKIKSENFKFVSKEDEQNEKTNGYFNRSGSK